MKNFKSATVTLNSESRNLCQQMMSKLKSDGENIKIDHSKLVSFIVKDYFEKQFEKNATRIIDYHRDSKKVLRKQLNMLDKKTLLEIEKIISKNKKQGKLNAE